MSNKIKVWRIDAVFVLIIFCLFIASVITVVMLGGRIYKSIAEKSQNGNDEDICLSYIWTKIKNGDEAGRVYIDDFYDIPALYLKEEYDGVVYQTIVYFYDGWVRELFCEEGLEFDPEDGTYVIEVDSLAFEQSDKGLIRAAANSKSVLIFPRSKAIGKDASS